MASDSIDHYCLPLSTVVHINALVVQKTSEPHAVIDAAAILGALGRPLQTYMGYTPFPTIIDKTGALIHGLATAHGFEQGNKRTSFIGGMSYLATHGYELRSMTEEESGEPLLALIRHEISLDDYTVWLANNLA